MTVWKHGSRKGFLFGVGEVEREDGEIGRGIKMSRENSKTSV